MSNLDQYSRKPSGGAGGRHVPASLAIGVAFGGVLATVGWCVFAGTMIFWWALGAHADFAGEFAFSGQVMQTQGRVLHVEETNFSEGGSDDSPGTPIYRYDFEYEYPVGNIRTASSFSTGQYYALGTAVPVEYVPGEPPVARIAKTRTGVFGPEIVFVAVFPGIGLLLVVISYVLGLRTVGVLRRGKLASGRLIEKKPTNTKINNQLVYALTFQFTDAQGQVQTGTVRTHHTGKAEDDGEERLFYDPDNPSQVRLVDLLPGGVKVGNDGAIEYAGISGAFLRAVLLPALALGIHGFVAWLVYG